MLHIAIDPGRSSIVSISTTFSDLYNKSPSVKHDLNHFCSTLTLSLLATSIMQTKNQKRTAQLQSSQTLDYLD